MKKNPRKFQDKYWKRQANRGPSSMTTRLLRNITGILMTIIGIILLFLPGPGWLFLIAGASFLAGESLIIARAMDAFANYFFNKFVKR